MAYEYKIGTDLLDLTLLSELDPPIHAPYCDPAPAVGAITLGDGSERYIGLPIVTWHWGFLTAAQRDVLKTYCPEKSAEIAIRSLQQDGTYADFTCIMIWPQREVRQAGRILDFNLEFRQMVLED
ncbi:MAG TPA: hypothetical protein PKD65_16115 [Nitrospira sp.]|nr:hypothetical protein [Nitrospira sp.]